MPPPSDQRTPSGDDDASLQQLSDAFAEMLKSDEANGADGGSHTAAEHTEHVAADVEHAPPAPLTALGTERDSGDCPVTPKSILEAMLFVGHPGNENLTARQAASIINGVSPREIDELVGELREEYDQQGYTYKIISDGTGYRLALRDQFDRIRNRFYGRIREAKLSQAAIEVLALVAYNQPTTSADVSNLRGHPSGSILAQLVRRQLLRMERPKKTPRTPAYHTTQRFLKLFGLTSLEELPKSQELEIE